MDAAGRARIAGFGLSTAQNLGPIQSASPERDHSPQRTAPQILDDQVIYTKEGDIFAFATVMAGVRCIGPFARCLADYLVFYKGIF